LIASAFLLGRDLQSRHGPPDYKSGGSEARDGGVRLLHPLEGEASSTS